MSKTTKKSDVEQLIANIRKQHGDGAAMTLKGQGIIQPVDVIPTGSLGLDLALGIGGYPKGRIVEVYGPEASGKTTLTLHALANVQAAGGLAAFIDAEHALDMKYAEHLGVDFNQLVFSQPNHGEQALDIVEQLVQSAKLKLVVIDSVAALVPRAELEGDMAQHHVGVQARMMSKTLRKLTGEANRTGTTIIFINQLRSKIGVMYGSPEVTTGGNALKFYASVRLDVRRLQQVKEAGDAVGNETRVKVIKNKHYPPFKECQFEIRWGEGIDTVGDLLNVAVIHGVVERKGAWFSYGETRLGQGFNNASETVRNDTELLKTIDRETRKVVRGA
jgi:recombination protein RecA